KHARRAVSWKPSENDPGFFSQTESDRQFGKSARMKPARPIGLEEVLAGPCAATDRHARSIRIDDEFFAGEPIIARRSPDVESTGAVDGQCVWELGRQTWNDRCEPAHFFLDGQAHRAV